MQNRKVLLINPFYSSKVYSIPVLPAGLGYLGESLRAAGIDYDVMDMVLGYKVDDLKRKIRDYSPDMIGFSMMTYRYKNIYKIMSEIKLEFPGVKIVCGGPHITNLKEKVLTECPAVDYAVTFEGEITLVELARGDDPRNIKGLAYRDGDKVFYTGDRGFMEDLDMVPFPKYEKFELKKYQYGISIVTSRGCPYSCVYCSCHLIGKKIRFRSAQNVVKEISYWYDKGSREFGLQEDNPTFDKKRMYELCDSIERMSFKDIMFMCGNGVRADRVDRDLLKRMKDVGFKRLAFGVEASSDEILKNIKKGLTIGTIEEAISIACDLGFYVSLFFLVGSPGETAADVKRSISLALKYPISDVKFNNLVPIPGTELYKWVEENNYFLMRPDEYLNMDPPAQMSYCPLFETPEFPARDRVKMLKDARKVERLVKRRVLEKGLTSFMGLNKIIAFLYTIDRVREFENWLMSHAFLRETLGKIRMLARKIIYARG